MSKTPTVRITEVAPRDGLQNEPGAVPTADKLRLIGMLAGCGFDEVEVTSFVSPKWVPQLADAAAVVAGINAHGAGAGLGVGAGLTTAASPGPAPAAATSHPGTGQTTFRQPSSSADRIDPDWAGYLHSEDPCVFSVLIPNDKGMDGFLRANVTPERPGTLPPLVQKISVFASASEGFSQKNLGASISESLQRFVPVIQRAQGHLLAVRGYLSMVIACPFDGPTDPAKVGELAAALLEMGCDEIDLGDTIGVGTPETVRTMLTAVERAIGGFRANRLGQPNVTLHLHDTFGRAGACVREAVQVGVRSFDGSVGGLGGCPYAGTPDRPAPGNISTGTLLAATRAEGLVDHVDDARLSAAANLARHIVAQARANASTPTNGATS